MRVVFRWQAESGEVITRWLVRDGDTYEWATDRWSTFSRVEAVRLAREHGGTVER